MYRGLLACICAVGLFAGGCSDDSGDPKVDGGADLKVDKTAPDPDQGTDGLAPDGPTPDGPVPDISPDSQPDVGLDSQPDVKTDVLPDDMQMAGEHLYDILPDVQPDLPPDLGPVNAGRCATAPVVQLVGGAAVINDDINKYANEFATACRTSTSSTTTMSGPQAYYQFQGVQDQWYRFVLEPNSTSFSAYMYVFTSTACTEAAIETDCQSEGVSGASLRWTADNDDPRVLYFKAPANGPVYVAVDDTTTPTDGTFKLTITAIPTPTNGTCAGATPLTFFNGKAIANGDTHFLMTPDEFSTLNCGSGGNLDAPQAYYKFTATAGQAFKIKVTNNAGYFVYFYVFGDSCVEADIQAACASGGATGAVISSHFDAPQSREIVFTAPTAGTYHIGIDGNDIYDYANFTLEVEEFTLPSNGKCATPDAISFINGKAVVSGSTLGLTNEFGTSIDCTTSPDFDGEQAYYRLTAAAGKAYKMTYAPSFSSYFYIFQEATCGNTASMNADCGSGGADGDKSLSASASTARTQIFRPILPGNYIVALDSTAPGTAGSYQLDIEEFDAPTNDTACAATPLTFTAGKVSINGSTDGARNEFGTTSTNGINCDISTVFDGVQVYYEFTVDATKGYKLSLTPQFASAYLYVFQKGSCAARASVDADCGSNGLSGARLGSVGSGQKQTLNFSPSNAGQYVVAIDTSNVPGGGDFLLEIEEVTKPTNDTCAAAAPLTLTNGTVTVNSSTGFAQDEYATLNCRSGTSTSANLDGPQLYWSLTMDATKNYAITATTSFASGYLYVFDGSKACSEANIETDCISSGATGIGKGVISNGSGTTYFKPAATGTYKIAIDSYNDSGDVSLKVVEFDPAANQTCAAAQTLTMSGGSVSVDGFTIGTSDEFAGAISCGGTTAYAGGQTYYKLNMQAGTTYYVNLAADHKAAVYLFSPASACTATAIEADCASGGTSGAFSEITSASGGTAGFAFSPAATGDYYLVVDTPTATDVGGYTLTVADSLPTLAIVEINTGSADYLVIKNTGTAAVQIGGVEIVLTDSTITAADNRFTLPARVLAPGQSVYIVEDSTPLPGDIYIGGNIGYIYSSSFTAMLCLGTCSATNAGNVIDLGRFGTATTPEVPTGITFTGSPVGGLNSTNQNTSSFTRTAFVGANPTFLASDWGLAAATR